MYACMRWQISTWKAERSHRQTLTKCVCLRANLINQQCLSCCLGIGCSCWVGRCCADCRRRFCSGVHCSKGKSIPRVYDMYLSYVGDACPAIQTCSAGVAIWTLRLDLRASGEQELDRHLDESEFRTAQAACFRTRHCLHYLRRAAHRLDLILLWSPGKIASCLAPLCFSYLDARVALMCKAVARAPPDYPTA